MLAKKCDRCGEYYDIYHYLSPIAKGKANGIILVDDDNDNDNTCISRKCIDLCPKCLTNFESWMTKIPERSVTNAER